MLQFLRANGKHANLSVLDQDNQSDIKANFEGL